MKTLLKNARCIVTCDDNDAILRGADVLMQDGVIWRFMAYELAGHLAYRAGDMDKATLLIHTTKPPRPKPPRPVED